MAYLGLVLAIRLPFWNQAILGDDATYLTAAAHALVEPLHPNNTPFVFQGRELDLRGHPHGPMNAWVLAGLIAVAGDVKEIPFHAAYMVFSLIAVWAMWSLARRFSPQPLWATLLFIAVPVFVVNGNSLETDVPFLAFWMASVALFPRHRLLAAAARPGGAHLAYQAVFLTRSCWFTRGSIAGATRPRGRPRGSGVTFVAWQVFVRLSTGAIPATVLAGYLAAMDLSSGAQLAAPGAGFARWFLVFPLLLPGAFAGVAQAARARHAFSAGLDRAILRRRGGGLLCARRDTCFPSRRPSHCWPRAFARSGWPWDSRRNWRSAWGSPS